MGIRFWTAYVAGLYTHAALVAMIMQHDLMAYFMAACAVWNVYTHNLEAEKEEK